MVWILAAFLLVLILIPLIGAALSIDDWSRDLSTNVAETSATASDERMRPLATTASFEEIEQATRQIADDSSAWEFEAVEPAEKAIRLVHVSGLLRFRDDVKLRVESSPDALLIHIHSQSRIGKGDLGQNPRNVRDIRERLSLYLGG